MSAWEKRALSDEPHTLVNPKDSARHRREGAKKDLDRRALTEEGTRSALQRIGSGSRAEASGIQLEANEEFKPGYALMSAWALTLVKAIESGLRARRKAWANLPRPPFGRNIHGFRLKSTTSVRMESTNRTA